MNRVVILFCITLVAAALGNECRGNDFDCESDDCPKNCDSDMWDCKGSLLKGNLECEHAALGEGNVGKDIGVVLTLLVFLGLASAAGIGGGGIVVPILIVLPEFPTYYAVPLSVTSIMGGSLVSFLMQIFKKHPNPSVGWRPLIEFNVIILLLPMALAGTVLGVLLNSVSPNWLIIATILIVLTFTSVKTFKKGKQLRAAELENRKTSKELIVSLDDVKADVKCEPEDLSPSMDEILRKEKLHDLIEKESRLPWRMVVFTFAELGGLIVLNIIKGGSGESVAGVECGSGAYAGVVIATFLYLLGCFLLGYSIVKRQYAHKVAIGYPFVKGDIVFEGKKLIIYPLYALFGGLMAGFLGIGGGMILAPLLLAFGMLPIVSSASTSYMTLFTSVSSFVQFVVLDRLLVDYAVLLFFVAALVSAIGQLVLSAYIKRTGRNSIIAFIVVGIIVIANVLLVIVGTLNIVEDAQAGKSFGFRPLC